MAPTVAAIDGTDKSGYAVAVFRTAVFGMTMVLSSLAFGDSLTFQGDRLTSTFTQGLEKTELGGHARVTTDDLTIEADSIELSGKEYRYLQCTGQVTVKNTKKHLTLKAGNLSYDRTLKTSRFWGQAQLDDPDRGVTVSADRFDYDETAEVMVLQAGVRILKGELVCRSEYALYKRTADTLELQGLPVVTKKKDEYKAGTIRVNLKSEDVILEGGVTGTITPEKKATAAPEAKP